MNILIILIFAAIIHACWNAYIKNKGNSLNKVVILYSLISLYAIPFTFFIELPSGRTFTYLFVSVIAHTMYMHSLARAYTYNDFSVAYPFARGLAPLLTILILILIFGKSITISEFIGILIIVLAIFTLLDFKKINYSMKGILSLLYFPLSIGFYTIVDAMGVRSTDSPEQFIIWLFVLIPIPLSAYVLINNKNALKLTFVENKYSLIVASIGSLTSYSLVLWAYTQAPIYYVASIRESSIIFASLIGLIFFKEKGLVRRLIAAFVLFIGVIMLELAS